MKYTVKMYPRAYRDLDEIYSYISVNLMEQGTAEKMIADLENAIFSLEQFPKRGSVRRIGVYANQDYRQLFIKKYTVIYRVYDKKQEVHIVTVRYAPSRF